MKVKHLKLKQVAGKAFIYAPTGVLLLSQNWRFQAVRAGYVYLGFENKVLEYQKREERRNRYIKRKIAK